MSPSHRATDAQVPGPHAERISEVDFERLAPVLRQFFQELDLSESDFSEEASPATASAIFSDLKSNLAELTELCEVLSNRALSRPQLQALAQVELAVERLQDIAFRFMALFT
jgi:hypothetical protein